MKLVQVIYIVISEELRNAHSNDAINTIFLVYNLFVLTLLLSMLSKYVETTQRNYRQLDESGSPFANASVVKRLFFTWTWPMLKLGRQKTLEKEDTYPLRNQESAEFQSKLLSRMLKAHDQPSIFWAVFRCYYTDIAVTFLQQALQTLLNLSGAAFILLIEQYLSNPEVPYWKGIAILGYIFAVKFVGVLNKTSLKFRIALINSHLKSSVSSILFKKSMKISTITQAGKDEEKKEEDNANFTFAQTVNLMQIDLERISWGITYSLEALVFPVQITICITILYMVFDKTGVYAVLIVCAGLFVVNLIVAYFIQKIEVVVMDKKDLRMKACNEMLNYIKVFKLYNWETKMAERVKKAR